MVLKSLRRFAELESGFGSRFRRYRLASISGFHKAGTSTSNLGHCLEQAKDCSPTGSPGQPLSTLMNKMKVPDSIGAEIVLTSLQKVELDPTLPKLGDIDSRVRQAIERLDGMGDYRASDLLNAAESIIGMAEAAGQATKESSAEDYFAYLDGPDGHAARSAIAAKRLGLETVRQALLEAATEAALLRSREGSDFTQLPSSSGIAERKLDAGGVPVHVVDLLNDLRSSVEEEVQRRLYRDGRERANGEYDHAQVLVQALAEDARQASRQGDKDEYGQEMWSDLRRRFTDLSQTNPASLVGFSPEHLTGVAMILTELCKVWWSEPFDLKVEK